MTTKKQQLADAVRAGTHRIVGLHVWRWHAASSQWITDAKWRKDTVRSAAVILMQDATQPPRSNT